MKLVRLARAHKPDPEFFTQPPGDVKIVRGGANLLTHRSKKAANTRN